MNILVETEIDKPKIYVWKAITDIENCSNMVTGIIALKVIHKPKVGLVGLKWTETRQMFGKDCDETMWITDAVDEHYYSTRAESHGAIYTSKLAVEENAGKTTLSMSFSSTSHSFFVRLMSSLMSVFIKKSMIKMVQADLEDIKNFVEAKPDQ